MQNTGNFGSPKFRSGQKQPVLGTTGPYILLYRVFSVPDGKPRLSAKLPERNLVYGRMYFPLNSQIKPN